ncbi:MAG: hypothetical protein ACTHPD_10250, partial [Rhizomicrobium sp.]
MADDGVIVATRAGRLWHAFLLFLIMPFPALAGPPYVTDDPAPTDKGHFEIYAFDAGTSARGGVDGQAGIDFNYGGAADLQLTAVLPLNYEKPGRSGLLAGI